MNELIAIIDDEADIVELISLHLKKNGFRVKEFYDAHSFFSFLDLRLPNLIILDLMLPDIDGFEICKKLRNDQRTSLIPIVMLTAKVEEVDKILGLELGADDYITKPFSPRELIARIRAILRRKQDKTCNIIKIGDDLVIDLNKYEVFVDNKKMDLTITEFRILKLLCEHKGWVYSRSKILDYLWGEEKAIIDRTIDVHMKNLRGKLGKAGRYIVSIRGVGYKIQE